MSSYRMKLLALLPLALCAATAAAQTPGIRPVHRHDGFWFSIGGGGGWEDFDGSLGNEGRGGGFYLRLGGTPNPRLLFGGEVIAWFTGSDFNQRDRANVMGTALVYPLRAGGWFVRGGFGFAEHTVRDFDRSGLGTLIGTGFDVRLGRNFYITPNVDYLTQFFDNGTTGVLLVTLGATWH